MMMSDSHRTARTVVYQNEALKLKVQTHSLHCHHHRKSDREIWENINNKIKLKGPQKKHGG
jgi:hypothetical protein